MELLVRSGVDVRGKTAVILVRPHDDTMRVMDRVRGRGRKGFRG